MTRLAPQPGERIDRDRPLRFTFDGQPVAGLAGDTFLSAMYADGRRVFSRSFKYHRPRGELCGCGRCIGSLVAVDGVPGVRACGEPARDGARVTHVNAWPSLGFDVLRAADLVGGPVMPVGFYYKTFIRPRRLWPVYERVLRHAAGLGRLPATQAERTTRNEYRRRHCDVAVIGGGIAGLSAAVRAAEAGADVVLCDEDVEPGGALLFDGQRERARALVERARASGVEILSRAAAIGFFDGLVPVWQGQTLHQVRAARHVIASGAIQQPLVFIDNDLPGIMLSGAATRLAALYALPAGQRVVVATVDDRGLRDALSLLERGVQVAAVVDQRPGAPDDPLVDAIRAQRAEVLHGAGVLRAVRGRGAKVLEGVVLEGGRHISCDALAVSGGELPALSLALQAGATAGYDAGRASFALATTPDGMHVAGAAAGHGDAGVAERSGRLAGAEAAAALGLRVDGLEDDRHALASPHRTPVAEPRAARGRGKAFVDFDEDVTTKDVAHAAAEGYDSIELSKRYTTATMGPTQGRFSQLAAVRELARLTSLPLGEVGLTTARPPWVTVPMGVLAGRPHEPAKRTALHARHRALGATIRWAGDWRRAYDYGAAEAEAQAVGASAGLIDVSTLGKLIVRGPDAGELLDRLYPNRMSTLAPGRIRYGVVCSEAGRIVDDGTVARLDDETFYVTTTTTGAAGIEAQFSWWLATWRLDVHITDVTQGLVALNLAGPRARALLSEHTSLDVGNEAFPYLGAQQAEVARVPCLMLRIGFVGELGYEIHCPAAQGHVVWDALAAAGARPFGLEPQRRLRLEKLHVLIGQDTDSESTPEGAGMGWIVKLDKEQDFVGRWALEHAEAHPPATSLVGFSVPDGRIPTEGAVVLGAGDQPVGQVTSARRSPRLGTAIGMAWVPAAVAADGASVTISDRGERIHAQVTTRPFFDPEGAVLRS